MALARVFGAGVGGFRLSFLGATAHVRGLEKLKLWQRYAVYLAGPATNAIFAVAAWVAARFLWWPGGQAAFLYNVVLAVFNLLPVLPLDGGRLAQLFLGNRIGIIRANRILLKAGPAVGGVLMVLGIAQAILYPFNLTMLCAGVYIRRKNTQLKPQLYWECIKALQAKDKNNMPTKKIILPKDTTVAQAVEHLGWDYFAVIHIGDDRCIPEDELLKYIATF